MGIRTEEIAAYLRTVPAVTALIGTRIWTDAPISDSQPGPYAVLDSVTQGWDSVTNSARVEVRIVGKDESTTRKAIEDAMLAVRQALVESSGAGARQFATFTAYRIRSGSAWIFAQDEKRRRVLIHDFIVESIY